MGLSIRAYGKHRGCSHEAMRKALAAGRIALGPDGTIDPAAADASWTATTAPRTPGIAEPQAARHQADAGGTPNAGAMLGAAALLQARTAISLVEAQLRRLRLEERRGQLIDRPAALATIFAHFRARRDAWLAWPSRIGAELAADLGVDAVRLQIALEP